jgi:hypothetical protein
MPRKFLIVIIVTLSQFSFSLAQRKGAIETGGAFSFKNISTADSSTKSHLNLEVLLGYYLSRNAIIEIEPSFQFDSANELASTSIIFITGFAYRILDMAPSEFRLREYRKVDLGVSAGVFASVGAGLWSDVLNTTNKASISHTAGAFSAGLGTRSGFGKFTVMRTKAQIIYLMPSSAPYDKARTIFQIGIGFSVFMRT